MLLSHRRPRRAFFFGEDDMQDEQLTNDDSAGSQGITYSNNGMGKREIRLQIVLAMIASDWPADDVAKDAKAYADFVLGK